MDLNKEKRATEERREHRRKRDDETRNTTRHQYDVYGRREGYLWPDGTSWYHDPRTDFDAGYRDEGYGGSNRSSANSETLNAARNGFGRGYAL